MTGPQLDPAAQFKQQAAVKAASLVRDGMAVGLGTGSTAVFVVAELGRRVREEGLRICAIPTSDATEAQAKEEGIPITGFAEHPDLDIAIDGADEIEPGTLNLVKGRGGALLREKIVASAARQFVVVADNSKYVDHLGTLCPVPVEVVPFGWESAAARLARLGAHVAPRKNRDGSFYLTDEKNLIMDCVFGRIEDPDTLSQNIYNIVGVIEHGLFLHMTTQTITAGPEGIRFLHPGNRSAAQLSSEVMGSKQTLPSQPAAEGIGKHLLVIMGVSGCGKTTIAEGLRNELGWPFQEGDDLHPSANVQKMAAGIPLNDEDRWPWLERCHEWLAECEKSGSGAILTCSALKRSYRDVLRRDGLNPVFIYLHVDETVLIKRLQTRKGHYMPASLLPSQLQTLEPPTDDEHAMTISVASPPPQTIATILTKLKSL